MLNQYQAAIETDAAGDAVAYLGSEIRGEILAVKYVPGTLDAAAGLVLSGETSGIAVMTKALVAGNLFSNGGFETAGAGGADVFGSWTEHAADGAIADEETLFHGGAHAVKITAGTEAVYVLQTFVVIPEQSYRLSFWTRGDGDVAGRYEIDDQTAAAAIVATVASGVVGEDYEQVVVDFDAPAGCLLAQVVFHSSSTAGIHYLDDAFVVPLAGAWYYPRTLTAKVADGSAFTDVAVPICLLKERLKVVVSGGGDTKAGAINLWTEEEQ